MDETQATSSFSVRNVDKSVVRAVSPEDTLRVDASPKSITQNPIEMCIRTLQIDRGGSHVALDLQHSRYQSVHTSPRMGFIY